jgi:hypothetical protein
MDGLKLYLNHFYNGWKHNHYVGAVIVFCPDGTIPICCFNVPGSVHDSLMAERGSVYDKLERVYARCGGKCTVDSAFSKKIIPMSSSLHRQNLVEKIVKNLRRMYS